MLFSTCANEFCLFGSVLVERVVSCAGRSFICEICKVVCFICDNEV